jgi:hypothetical protein
VVKNDKSDEDKNYDKICRGCKGVIISAPFYCCAHAECIDFFVHTQCAKLFKMIEEHPLDNFHTLNLLSDAKTTSGVFLLSSTINKCKYIYTIGNMLIP